MSDKLILSPSDRITRSCGAPIRRQRSAGLPGAWDTTVWPSPTRTTSTACGNLSSACHEEGLTPIVGAEITDPNKKHRAVCLVKDATGYANLCRLITRRHRDPAFDLSTTLPHLAGGLLVLVTHAGLLAAWHRAGVHTAAALPRRPPSPFHPMVQTARDLDVPLVATPGSFFLEPDGFAVHRLLRAIAGNTASSRLGPGDVAPIDAWLAPPEEYHRRFNHCPEALGSNTREIADELTFTGPAFGLVMPPWKDGQGRSADSCLRQAAYAGARSRYGQELNEAVVERLEHELAVIARMDFSAYFLVVEQIVSQSPRTCGRGSAAASLVAYCLNITNVCPVKHNLYFGRFLNPGRRTHRTSTSILPGTNGTRSSTGCSTALPATRPWWPAISCSSPAWPCGRRPRFSACPMPRSAKSPGACPGSGSRGELDAGLLEKSATAPGNPPPGFRRPLAADHGPGPADHRHPAPPVRASRRRGDHPGIPSTAMSPSKRPPKGCPSSSGTKTAPRTPAW
jgi:hypothetical protein